MRILILFTTVLSLHIVGCQEASGATKNKAEWKADLNSVGQGLPIRNWRKTGQPSETKLGTQSMAGVPQNATNEASNVQRNQGQTLSPRWPPPTMQSQWQTTAIALDHPEGTPIDPTSAHGRWLNILQQRQAEMMDASPTGDGFSSSFNMRDTMLPFVINPNGFRSTMMFDAPPAPSYFEHVNRDPYGPSFPSSNGVFRIAAPSAQSQEGVDSTRIPNPPTTLGDQHMSTLHAQNQYTVTNMPGGFNIGYPGIPITMTSRVPRYIQQQLSNLIFPSDTFSSSPGVKTLFQAASSPIDRHTKRAANMVRQTAGSSARTSAATKEQAIRITGDDTLRNTGSAPSLPPKATAKSMMTNSMDQMRLRHQQAAMFELQKRQAIAANNFKIQQDMLSQIKDMLATLTTFFERGMVNRIIAVARSTLPPSQSAPSLQNNHRVPTSASGNPTPGKQAPSSFPKSPIPPPRKQATIPKKITVTPPQVVVTPAPVVVTTKRPVPPTTTTVPVTTKKPTTPVPTTTTTKTTVAPLKPPPTVPPQDLSLDAVVQGSGSLFQFQGKSPQTARKTSSPKEEYMPMPTSNAQRLTAQAMQAAIRRIQRVQRGLVPIPTAATKAANSSSALPFTPLSPLQRNRGMLSYDVIILMMTSYG